MGGGCAGGGDRVDEGLWSRQASRRDLGRRGGHRSDIVFQGPSRAEKLSLDTTHLHHEPRP